MPLNIQTIGTAAMITAIGDAQTAQTNTALTLLEQEREFMRETPLLLQATKEAYDSQANQAKKADFATAGSYIANTATIVATYIGGSMASKSIDDEADALERAEQNELQLQKTQNNPSPANISASQNPKASLQGLGDIELQEIGPKPISDEVVVGGKGAKNQAPAVRKQEEQVKEEQQVNKKEDRSSEIESKRKRAQGVREQWTNNISPALQNLANAGGTFAHGVYQANQLQDQGTAAYLQGAASTVDRLLSSLSAYEQAMASSVNSSNSHYATLAQLGASRG